MRAFRCAHSVSMIVAFGVVLATAGCPPPTPKGPEAEFRANVTTGVSPLAVQFIDLSVPGVSPIISWSWLFGDGASSTQQDPSHTYAAAGMYNVSLTVAAANGEDTELKLNFISVSQGGEGQTETILLPGREPLEMVRIPAGSFQMGSPDTERSRDSDEGPVHPVTIGYDFYLAKYEVTQGQWLAVMGSWPGTAPSTRNGRGYRYPAYYVSWDDAQAFIVALNAHLTATGQGPATMRLPSEAEWEYACRAGTQTRFYFGDSLSVGDVCEDDGIRSQYMWYGGNNTDSWYGSKPVGGLLPNAFGLYDMSGNVREWCEDDWHGSYTGAPADGSAWLEAPWTSYRVIRGGCWIDDARYCRSAFRTNSRPSRQDYFIGFRLAR